MKKRFRIPAMVMVIAFIAATAFILTAGTSPIQAQVNFNKVKDINRASGCYQNLANIGKAVRQYQADNKKLPASVNQLIPGYMQSIPTCPAFKKVTYVVRPASGNQFIVVCAGTNHTESPQDYPRYDSRQGVLSAPGTVISPP